MDLLIFAPEIFQIVDETLPVFLKPAVYPCNFTFDARRKLWDEECPPRTAPSAKVKFRELAFLFRSEILHKGSTALEPDLHSS